MSDSDLALVRARRAAISREIEELQEEDDDLEVTERVLARLQAAKAKANGNGAHVGPPAPLATRTMSQPEYVLGTLRAAENPWIESAVALQNMVRKVHGVDIPTNSFHPIISNLTKRGVVLRDGPRIALAERIAKGH